MNVNDLLALGYPEQFILNQYYTARIELEVGVTIAGMSNNVTMIQFFPWTKNMVNGHECYAKFITDNAKGPISDAHSLLQKWPFVTIDKGDNDILMIKCIIEEQREKWRKQNADDRTSGADAAAGKALE